MRVQGQARDPQNVQPHLKKCFEGIKRLEMHAPGSEGRRVHEVWKRTTPVQLRYGPQSAAATLWSWLTMPIALL
jgi:hypothetical protein